MASYEEKKKGLAKRILNPKFTADTINKMKEGHGKEFFKKKAKGAGLNVE